MNIHICFIYKINIKLFSNKKAALAIIHNSYAIIESVKSGSVPEFDFQTKIKCTRCNLTTWLGVSILSISSPYTGVVYRRG